LQISAYSYKRRCTRVAWLFPLFPGCLLACGLISPYSAVFPAVIFLCTVPVGCCESGAAFAFFAATLLFLLRKNKQAGVKTSDLLLLPIWAKNDPFCLAGSKNQAQVLSAADCRRFNLLKFNELYEFGSLGATGKRQGILRPMQGYR
jgi:hypothetical protein